MEKVNFKKLHKTLGCEDCKWANKETLFIGPCCKGAQRIKLNSNKCLNKESEEVMETAKKITVLDQTGDKKVQPEVAQVVQEPATAPVETKQEIANPIVVPKGKNKRGKNKSTKEKVELLARFQNFRKDGKSTTEAAKEVGVSYVTLHSWKKAQETPQVVGAKASVPKSKKSKKVKVSKKVKKNKKLRVAKRPGVNVRKSPARSKKMLSITFSGLTFNQLKRFVEVLAQVK